MLGDLLKTLGCLRLMLSPLRLCSRNATTKTQPEDRTRRGARRGHGAAAESGPNVSGRGAAASGRAKQGASWDAARPGGDAETMLETTTEDRERDRSSADEAAAGLGRTTPILKAVLLRVKCRPAAPAAAEKPTSRRGGEPHACLRNLHGRAAGLQRPAP